MKKDLIKEIIKKTSVTEKGLRPTLSRIKKRHDLKSIEQAACYYIKKYKVDINVSSVIDEITRKSIQSNSSKTPHSSVSHRRSPRPRSFSMPKIRWVSPSLYALSERLSECYGYMFLFENALRLKIDTVMKVKKSNWWEENIKKELQDVYKYVEDEKKKQARLPMVGRIDAMQSIDYTTIGHLEQIIVKYQKDFIPSCFPNPQFFTGHMVIIKRVRNALAHMAPSITSRDIGNAKHEIDILLQHLSTVS